METRIKKQVLNYELKKCELDEMESLSQEYREKFYSEVYPEELNDLHTDVRENNPPPEVHMPEITDGIRKVYKELCLKVHPDRNVNNNEDDRKYKEELFKEIQESYENEDYCDLLVKAKELRVDIPELKEEDINVLETNIKVIEEKMERIKKEISWVWCTTTNPQTKERIRKLIDKLIKETLLKDHVLLEEDGCPICLETMEIGNIEKRLPCGHVFHKACILSWFSISFTCPMCRLSFE